MGELKWSTVQLPTTFITENWPVRVRPLTNPEIES